MDESLTVLRYQNIIDQVRWEGHSFEDASLFDLFISEEVTNRLNDAETTNAFKTITQGLKLTGFGAESLSELLNSNTIEEIDWAIGEAIAEVWLNKAYGVIWPWNMARDKRNPKASLPGADLIGFINKDSAHQFVFGEVKTSGDKSTPPNVLSGRSGLIHQIDNLATNLTLINTLLRWLFVRCKISGYGEMFQSSMELFLNSGNKAVSLYGVLIRDLKPNEHDLMSHSKALSRKIVSPTTCHLVALYIPCLITELPEKVRGTLE